MLDSAPVAWLCPRVFKAGGEGEHPCEYLARSGLDCRQLYQHCTVRQCHLLLHLSVAFVAAFGSAPLSLCRCGWADHTGSADRELWKCSGSVPAWQPHGWCHHPGHCRRAGAALPDTGEVLCQDAEQNYQGMCSQVRSNMLVCLWQLPFSP